ncbi:MAG: right-handed parallel beta-helix repeat-containing protein [Bacteroidota bacterium]
MKKGLIFLLATFFAISAYCKEYHVSVKGNDKNEGSAAKPLKTISAAALLAKPGDIITVHAGSYKERVAPPLGGTSAIKRIVYRAAKGEKVEIKGSEVLSGWTLVEKGVWKVTIPNTFFGNYNPYKDLIAGDWFDALGRIHHTGEVYLNGKSLYEADSLKKVFNPAGIIIPAMLTSFTDVEGSTYTWYTESDEKQTTIYANFHGHNPNKELVEINVRETCFYPSVPGINYITVQGFHMSQAATQWAAPTAEQIGMIGTHWSKGWIIENNVVSDSKCAGITLGKDRKSGHNVWTKEPSKDGAVLYNEVVVKAIEQGWNKDHIGSHIVRNNTIFNCGVAGICGSLGAAFSQITGNHIYDIWTKRLFTGPEKGGIKIHAAVDVLIKGNRIHNAHEGIWLDWMAQGTRTTANLCYKNDKQDFFAEVDHGPYIVDNNLFLSQVALWDWSESGAYINNLIAGKLFPASQDRETPYFKAHSTVLAGSKKIQGSGNHFYSNVFTTNQDTSSIYEIPKDWGGERDYGLAVYNGSVFPIKAANNVYLHGAPAYKGDTNFERNDQFNPSIKLSEENGHVYLTMKIYNASKITEHSLITTGTLGKALIPEQSFDDTNGKPIVFDTDYFGHKRDEKHSAAGPFEKPGVGLVKLKVW